MDTKLTVRVPKELLENAKRYARAKNTTLTRMISLYLERLPAEPETPDYAPLVRRLTGVLSPDFTVEDYQKHLEEKYGGR